MKLVILTAKGVPVKRDILPEILRRAQERVSLTPDQVRAIEAGYAEFEAEQEAYADTLTRSPEWGGREPGTK